MNRGSEETDSQLREEGEKDGRRERRKRAFRMKREVLEPPPPSAGLGRRANQFTASPLWTWPVMEHLDSNPSSAT